MNKYFHTTFLLIASMCLLVACKPEDKINYFPEPTEGFEEVIETETVEAIEEIVATAEAPSIPLIKDWVLTDPLEAYQQEAFNKTIELLWKYIFNPPEGSRPDCNKAAALFSETRPGWAELYRGYCDRYAKDGYFLSAVSLDKVTPEYLIDVEEQYIQFKLDSGVAFRSTARYWEDGASYGYVERPRSVWNIFMKIENEEARIVAVRLDHVD